MAKIRDDLDGVVLQYGEDGTLHTLRAGDDVPDGVLVGDHLTAPADHDDHDDHDGSDEGDEGDEGEPAPSKPRGNSGREAWVEYATALGVEFDVDATREDIKAAIEATQD